MFSLLIDNPKILLFSFNKSMNIQDDPGLNEYVNDFNSGRVGVLPRGKNVHGQQLKELLSFGDRSSYF